MSGSRWVGVRLVVYLSSGRVGEGEGRSGGLPGLSADAKATPITKTIRIKIGLKSKSRLLCWHVYVYVDGEVEEECYIRRQQRRVQSMGWK